MMNARRVLTSAWLSIAAQSLVGACGGGKPDPSSYDGTTVGDQERDHDVKWASPFRRAHAEERRSDEAGEAKNPGLAAPRGRDVGSSGGKGGSEKGTTGEHGGPPRGSGL